MRLLALRRMFGLLQKPPQLPDVELVEGLKREARLEFGSKPYPRPEVDGERSVHRMTTYSRKLLLVKK